MYPRPRESNDHSPKCTLICLPCVLLRYLVVGWCDHAGNFAITQTLGSQKDTAVLTADKVSPFLSVLEFFILYFYII